MREPRTRLRSRDDLQLAVVGADGAGPGGRAVDEHAVRERHAAEPDLVSVTGSGYALSGLVATGGRPSLEQRLQLRGAPRRAAARGRRRAMTGIDLAHRRARERLVGARSVEQGERALARRGSRPRAPARATAPRVTPGSTPVDERRRRRARRRRATRRSTSSPRARSRRRRERARRRRRAARASATAARVVA